VALCDSRQRRAGPLLADRRRQPEAAPSHWTNSWAHYREAIRLLEASKRDEDGWYILPAHIGYAWALEQSGATNEAVAQYRLSLKLAWTKEVGGVLDEVRETLRWSVQMRRWSGWQAKNLGVGEPFSEEVMDQLEPLLDPRKDAKELADIKKKRAKLSTMGRAITPIVTPVSDANRLDALVDPEARVLFDLDGSGLPKTWSWITPAGAWLVWDPRGTGRITSGLQLFGAVTWWMFWHDGYEALEALDDDGNGVLEGAELKGLALWRDANGNGVSEPGEVRPLNEYGIIRVECRPSSRDGGIPQHPEGMRTVGGLTRPTYDWMAPMHGFTPLR
jgi:hypothetical protein